MAHAAIAFAKANNRRRMMACTTSVGPGRDQPRDGRGTRARRTACRCCCCRATPLRAASPIPVLQQLEDFGDPTITANDCLRPVSRFWDRITRPEQLLASLPQAIAVLLDPADCGPATLALAAGRAGRGLRLSRPLLRGARSRHRAAAAGPRAARRGRCAAQGRAPPVHRRGRRRALLRAHSEALAEFAARHGIPVAETQAGKGALAWDHACNAGAIGVTGSSAANRPARGIATSCSRSARACRTSRPAPAS